MAQTCATIGSALLSQVWGTAVLPWTMPDTTLAKWRGLTSASRVRRASDAEPGYPNWIGAGVKEEHRATPHGPGG